MFSEVFHFWARAFYYMLTIQLAILRYWYPNIFFFFSAFLYWLKDLGICPEDCLIRADFLNEVTWQEAHPIYKISLVSLCSELKARILPPVQGSNEERNTKHTHRHTRNLKSHDLKTSWKYSLVRGSNPLPRIKGYSPHKLTFQDFQVGTLPFHPFPFYSNLTNHKPP